MGPKEVGPKKVVIDKNWLNQGEASRVRVRRVHKFEQMRVTRSEDLPELMSAKEAAKVLECHYKTVEEYRNDGSLKFLKRRGRYFTTPEFIAEFIESEDRKR